MEFNIIIRNDTIFVQPFSHELLSKSCFPLHTKETNGGALLHKWYLVLQKSVIYVLAIPDV